MDRRTSLKTLLVGTVGGAALTTVGCKTEEAVKTPVSSQPLYGRTPEELERDARIKASIFLNEHELETIAVLCDIILPANDSAGSATDAEVPAFIEFIVKDIPAHQLPMRGGLMWLDTESNRRFNKKFITCEGPEQLELIDDIAFPDPDNRKPEMAHGIRFFDLMRNLTLTGYYTSKMGIEDLGYVGNAPNVWDGVPAEVLQDHEVDYDPEWVAKCIDQSKRNEIAQWNDEGDLIT